MLILCMGEQKGDRIERVLYIYLTRAMKISAWARLAGKPSMRKPGAAGSLAIDWDSSSITSSCINIF